MRLRSLQSLLVLPALGMFALPLPARAQNDFTGLVGPLKSYHYGDSAAPLDAIAAQVAQARSSPERRQEAARALAAVLLTDAAFEAKQFACRQLVFVAGDDQVPALASLLSEDALAHYSVMALARIHSRASGDALFKALSTSSGKTEIELLSGLAESGDTRAVTAAQTRLKSSDPALRDTAATTIAKLGDTGAVQSLRAAYAESAADARLRLAHALLEAASRLHQSGSDGPALEIYQLVGTDPPAPFLAAVALRGIAQVRGEQALPTLLKALAEEGTPRQNAAATVLREAPGHQVTDLLSKTLPTLHGRAQILGIEILGDRADPAAAPAVMALCGSADPAVRVAAVRASGSIGDSSSVPVLLTTASATDADTRAAARESLVRLHGASVDRAIIAALDSGSPSTQVQAIQILGQRGTMGVAPRLLKASRSPDAGVSIAALRVLRDQASPALLPTLVDLLLTCPPGSRDGALDAVTQIARRSPSTRSAMPLLLERLARSDKPADRAALVTVIGQVAGPGAFDALRRAAVDSSGPVRVAAISALAEWQTDQPMEDLLRVARTGRDPGERAIALRGYLRMASDSDKRSATEAFALFDQVRGLAVRPAEKRLLLAGLSHIPSLEALDAARALGADSQVRPEAELAVVEISRATCGAWPDKTRAALEPIVRSGVNDDARRRATSILEVSRKFGNFDMAWEVSPAYQRDGADYSGLFDIKFAPEEAGESTVPWRLLPVGANSDQPWVLDLFAALAGEQRVAYLRSAVWAESARDLVLEAGSDDGLKVWWNGEVILSHNTARAVAPGQEKAVVHAKAGWNRILLKVTQNNQGWAACARFTGADGAPAAGLRFAVPRDSK